LALDATVGGAGANSFGTIAEGDAYFADRLFASGWTSASDANKAAALVMATRALNSLCYLGTAAADTQALAFPRTGLTLPSGYATSTGAIPQLVKEAMFEFALFLLNATTDPTLEKSQFAEGLKELKADVVTLKFRDDFDIRLVPANVMALIPEAWLCKNDVVTVQLEAL